MYDSGYANLTEFRSPMSEFVRNLNPDNPPRPEDGADTGALRNALADYLIRNQDIIRDMARSKLTRDVQGVCDSEDVFSSVLRRLDEMVIQGTLKPRSVSELWKCIEAITVNLAVDRVRIISRLRQFTSEDGVFAREVIKRLEGYVSDDQAAILLYRMMMSLPVALDRQLLDLRFRGATIKAAAGLLGMTMDSATMRWYRLRGRLSDQFREGQFDDASPGECAG